MKLQSKGRICMTSILSLPRSVVVASGMLFSMGLSGGLGCADPRGDGWDSRDPAEYPTADTLRQPLADEGGEAGIVAPPWVPAASMTTARSAHTATRLTNGRVLVVGGYSVGYLNSAELYDPEANGWKSSLLSATRVRHTATLLGNGKVLVVGGTNGTDGLMSAELYDPATNAWTAASSTSLVRFMHTATLLADGKVLVAGGAGVSSRTSAELYDPATDSWTAAGSLNTPHASHTATLLADGNVLITGGYAVGEYLASAELYDPATNSWATVGSLSTAREGHTATLLANGKVLVAGGDNNAEPLASAELYDPATNSWTAAGSLSTEREYHAATLLGNGTVLAMGGFHWRDWTGENLASAERYNPVTNTWTAAGSLSTARYGHTATLLANGKVLVAGGSNTCELFTLR
ncbi:MAG TPA: kelch repeat-containing protein [Sorangium sp.]|nr:kelch repeat-containing protein [Sorangium sp.]